MTYLKKIQQFFWVCVTFLTKKKKKKKENPGKSQANPRETPRKLWANPGKTLGKPRENPGKTTGKPRQTRGKTTGKPQENPRKTPGKPWANPGKIPEKPWENPRKTPGKPRRRGGVDQWEAGIWSCDLTANERLEKVDMKRGQIYKLTSRLYERISLRDDSLKTLDPHRPWYSPAIRLVLMIHWFSAKHLPPIHNMQVNFVMFLFKTAIWIKLKWPQRVKITPDKFCNKPFPPNSQQLDLSFKKCCKKPYF